MKPFAQYVQERSETPFLHEDAIVMRLRDFIDALELLDAQKSDEERLVEVREDVPEPGALTVRLLVRDEEEERP